MQFWKQFFEASANVSLSGVEEREEEDLSFAQTAEETSVYGEVTSPVGDETLQHNAGHSFNDTDDSLLDGVDISGSTPRAPRPRTESEDKPAFADFSSPYEALKDELRGTSRKQDNSQTMPTTPGTPARTRLPDMSMTPQSSPFEPTTYMQSIKKQGSDPLLHRILDKNYRLQATPHNREKESKTPANKPSWRDSNSPMSSPPVAAPQLRREFFDSPVRRQYTQSVAPRTPGVSVLTPGNGNNGGQIARSAKKDEISWESDSDEDVEEVYNQLGMSPPKTIQFSLPQSRVLQTPGMFSL